MNTPTLSVVRHIFANVVFTHKIQEVASENQQKFVTRFKIINLVQLFIILIFISLQLYYQDSVIFSYLSLSVSITEILFLFFQYQFNFEKKSIEHKNFALKYLSLRDRYLYLIADIMSRAISDDEVKKIKDILHNEYQLINQLAPQTGEKELLETQIRLNTNGAKGIKDFIWTDEEIDKFLPEKLRLS